MPKQLAILRADASSSIGSGHLFRALAMSADLRQAGYETLVLSSIPEPDFAVRFSALFSRSGSPLVLIESESAFFSTVNSRAPRLLFLDLRETESNHGLVESLNQIPTAVKKICFDEFFLDEVNFDLTIKPYIGAPARDGKRELLGPKYFVFRPELRNWAERPLKRNLPAKSILISMGGTDPKNISTEILKALCLEYKAINFLVVSGPGFKDKAQLKSVAAGFTNVSLFESPGDLGELYQRADCAIIGGGLSKYEAALFGLPCLLIAQTEQEEMLAPIFEKSGTGLYLGPAKDLSEAKLKSRFEKFLSDVELQKTMADNGRNLVDARGGKRIIEYIQQELS